MDCKSLLGSISLIALLSIPGPAHTAAITEFDSTQPRGSPGGVNDQRQRLDPIIEGFRSAARFGVTDDNFYRQWAGSIMTYATRDPSFLATLNVANQDMINFINALPGEPNDPNTTLGKFLQDNKLANDITRAADGSLQPEHLLPVSADFCLRCHAPAGWLEAHSEPPSSSFGFLKGDFWAAAFLEEPVDAVGQPRPADLLHESEAEMDGLQCDVCHRGKAGYKQKSLYNGSNIPAGNGGLFVTLTNPFGGPDALPRPINDFQETLGLCGTCHNVTNPLIKTKTAVNGVVPDMLHPLERTATEWYWSAYRQEGKQCRTCHEPMKFQGAQTWMLDPGMHRLWGNVDQKWVDRGYPVSASRAAALRSAARTNRQFMARKAAALAFVETPTSVSTGQDLTVKIKVTNLTGHKLPTGFAEGRQMWLNIKAVDGVGNVVFEDGVLNAQGYLVRTAETKVYEQEVVADGYPASVVANGDEHFRFVLVNNILKDNRIPPRGYNKAAYQADGAFIIPHDAKDTDYADGQYWDVTPYTFSVPASAAGPIRVTATLYYQTFSREYVDFLQTHDKEKTQANGGRARNLPTAGQYGNHQTWGEALHALWQDAGMGPSVQVGSATIAVSVQ